MITFFNMHEIKKTSKKEAFFKLKVTNEVYSHMGYV